MLLSQSEIEELTDSKTAKCQIKWLSDRGWVFEVSRMGRVKVLRDYAAMRMGMPVSGNITPSTEPDFSSLP